ncbi:lysylphosphatidylglycerol synthase transmembrane domain-containing protein [Rhodoferax sp.]|uniref:lysylphosphatidylglycerol synthase transmembrane domain-containing protein n=1 Tax=Rhodoferax sp. TaxID=50421 RepID=UPI002609C910|nr:lysylphosphatidylglycerol synthase transmembrane domain-containing protein [Rhodoferax sp.]MDD2926968.1 lysylphosphatidylglycerol synthase transmembrane domain-containing protein [Rhodoferax sp.]
MTSKEHLRLTARILVTLGLAGLLLYKLDLSQLLARFRSLSLEGTSLAFAAVIVAIVISAWKWGCILRARQHALPFLTLLRLYFVGLFFNNVLPTSVGGDAVRAWETTKETGEVPEAIGSVVSERLIAGVALGFTALLGLPFIEADTRTVQMVVVFLVIDVALVGLFLVPRIAEGIVGKTLPDRFSSVKGVVKRTVAIVRDTVRNPTLFVWILTLSIVFQLCVAAVNAAIFHALGASVSLAHCVIYTPMIFTVAMLPISISGFGVREAAYWYFFSQVGVSEGDAVATSLLFFVIVGISSLPGAPLFVFRKSRLQPI